MARAPNTESIPHLIGGREMESINCPLDFRSGGGEQGRHQQRMAAPP
ncbi:hypothetical protein [Devosia sp. RR2S18]|nr:hypothetical protein [Devosia sp. RR2S18]WIJ27202.1 hypothetical protein QOV41_07380 [Devosia sp. RR2S18]